MGWRQIKSGVRDRILSTQKWLEDHGISSEKVPDEVQQERISICEDCPSSSFLNNTRQCGKCLCFMDVKSWLVFDPVESLKKGSQERVECPGGHWDAYFVTHNDN